MVKPLHLTNARKFKREWRTMGGEIIEIRRTGEVRYVHTLFVDTVRVNDRRKDVPAVMVSRLNQLLRMMAANDDLV